MFDQASGNTMPAMRGGDREMMQIAAPAVVAAKNRAHDFAGRRFGDYAQPGIPGEKGRHAIRRIGLTQANTFASVPKGLDPRVVGNVHGANFTVQLMHDHF